MTKWGLLWVCKTSSAFENPQCNQHCCCRCWVTSVVSDSVRPQRRQPTRLPVPGILQARTLEWVAISFSNAWKWKVKVKSFSHVRLFATPWTAAHQAPPSMGFSRQEYWSGVPLPSPVISTATDWKRKKIGKDTWTSVFIAALFTVGKTGKQSSTHQQTSELRRYGRDTHWNITQPRERMKYHHLWQCGWIQRILCLEK